jgi:hypothetical protein
MKRCCQRQTQVLEVPVRRMISLVPTLSALRSTMAARQACFCEELRSLVIASSHASPSDKANDEFVCAESVNEIVYRATARPLDVDSLTGLLRLAFGSAATFVASHGSYSFLTGRTAPQPEA